jgi:hypothetical protein
MEDETRMSFSYDLEGIDRNALLTQVGSELHGLHGHLGSSSARTRKTPEEAIIDDIKKDNVGFDKEGSLYPYKITEEDFVSKKIPVPVPFRKL